ncbi:hypothetical protein UFOVP75_137 [uncultured Caudovirales phage]|uniref:Uncharacterized protein n=1 Tax=uncultured Caudovirales phage TaxID=2100421 RepID=A0A6J5L5Z3_9CAUD|nr:hypothetical protein UFOVP75_137 [uncultured Caudovirales phage]
MTAAAYISGPLTADASNVGVVTVASTTGLVIGARVVFVARGVDPLEVTVFSVGGGTSFTCHTNSDTVVDLSAYKVSLKARFTQYAQRDVSAFIPGTYVQRTGDEMTGPLIVDGQIRSTSGGFKFPDGTVQSSAAAFVSQFTTGNGGSVPASGALNGFFIRDDGVWSPAYATIKTDHVTLTARNTAIFTGDVWNVSDDGTGLQTVIGLNEFTDAVPGLAPPSGGGSVNWLQASGWRGIRQSDILPTFAITAFAGTASREIGQSLVTPAFTATYNRTPSTAALTDNAGSASKDVSSTPTSFASLGTFTKSGNNQTVTFTLTASDGTDPSVSANVTTTWLPKVFFGNAADTSSATSGFITALPSNALASSRARSFTATAGTTDHLYYAIPSSYGTPVFTVGGFAGGFSLVGTVSVTNGFSVSQNYDLWKSDSANLGTTTVVVS